MYGSMASADEIGTILGRPAVAGVDYLRATLHGWRLSWNVCTDNTTSREVRYYEPGTGTRPQIQVLFLNVEPDGDAQTSGYVMRVEAEHLQKLDVREGNYNRVLVTDEIAAEGGRPEVVWTYVGKPGRAANARAGIVRGTARIRRAYLDKVVAAFEGRGENLANLQAALARADVPVVELERRTYSRR
ncbi:gamma-glutamylcyclotransferase family protein [Paractinoplanes lichenicola]|uniref:Gamma-glutamylcyclotransferase n=1 Tax=Paractinoplanes lichenicola TaxID=2802976 RepID=A0ABS1W4D4_9ACTN|nr:gamma-glutamylcyclotransferase family protein [Actinoplanes lichenicola]MBL7261602.1 gamma-glutamylcyclotransferase [Actinoplanes lichenicola]